MQREEKRNINNKKNGENGKQVVKWQKSKHTNNYIKYKWAKDSNENIDSCSEYI